MGVLTLQMQIWDDHDIWDGWGSYPDRMQNCPVFQGMDCSHLLCRQARAKQKPCPMRPE